MVKPPWKYVGGKTQLLPQLLSRLPDDFETYHEPMVGGGALFFGLQDIIDDASISDINEELINAYLVVRDQVEALVGQLSRLSKKDYNTREMFERIRSQDPASMGEVARACRFIYLNKTCFNGLYRVNKEGKFNVPFGKYKNPKICNEENLRACAEALQGVEIRLEGFHTIITRAEAGDFVYFDPPYIPVSDTADFTSFTKGGFDEIDHQILADVFHQLTDNKVFVMLSNSDTPYARELYNGFDIEVVRARRSVNRDGAKRGKVNEILVRNY